MKIVKRRANVDTERELVPSRARSKRAQSAGKAASAAFLRATRKMILRVILKEQPHRD
jgi:hypothetical protein